ncbi:MAG: hypothetical protein ACOX6N_02105 [Patescibacteria group bacterium]|jgi:hypothetical protein
MTENKYLKPVTQEELDTWLKFEAGLDDPAAHEASYRNTVGEKNYIPNPRLRLEYQGKNIVQSDNAYPAIRPRQPAREEIVESVG